jgi:hypothetical protein
MQKEMIKPETNRTEKRNKHIRTETKSKQNECPYLVLCCVFIRRIKGKEQCPKYVYKKPPDIYVSRRQQPHLKTLVITLMRCARTAKNKGTGTHPELGEGMRQEDLKPRSTFTHYHATVLSTLASSTYVLIFLSVCVP